MLAKGFRNQESSTSTLAMQASPTLFFLFTFIKMHLLPCECVDTMQETNLANPS